MKKTLLFFLISIAVISCDRSNCKNTNPIFDKYSPESEEYKTELVNYVDQDKLTYWLESYKSENNKEYISVHIQGESLCAVGVIRVVDWRGIEGIKRTKGKGYRGAELVGLKFIAVKDSSTTELVYTGIDYIFD
jgi:hypothetical protein